LLAAYYKLAEASWAQNDAAYLVHELKRIVESRELQGEAGRPPQPLGVCIECDGVIGEDRGGSVVLGAGWVCFPCQELGGSGCTHSNCAGLKRCRYE
jgi:hypothetical protein